MAHIPPIVQDYLNTVQHLIVKMRENDRFLYTEEFDIINNKLTKLYRLMTDYERAAASSYVIK